MVWQNVIFSLPKRIWHSVRANKALAVAYLTEKLRSIVIPRIDFEDTTVEEAIDFLRLRAAELDTTELDPSKKGVNFVIRKSAGESERIRIKELRLKNVPLATALKYIADLTKLRIRSDDFAVTLVPQTETGEDIFTRTFRVSPDFAASLANNPKGATVPIKELLRSAGINFPEGSSATLASNDVLLFTNTPSEMDKVEQLVDVIGRAWIEKTPQSFGPGEGEGVLPPLDGPESAADPFAAPASGSVSRLEARPAIPTFPDRTRLWREANYFKNTRAHR